MLPRAVAHWICQQLIVRRVVGEGRAVAQALRCGEHLRTRSSYRNLRAVTTSRRSNECKPSPVFVAGPGVLPTLLARMRGKIADWDFLRQPATSKLLEGMLGWRSAHFFPRAPFTYTSTAQPAARGGCVKKKAHRKTKRGGRRTVVAKRGHQPGPQRLGHAATGPCTTRTAPTRRT